MSYRECKDTDRTGLYIMVFIIMLNSCETNRRVKQIQTGKQETITQQAERIIEDTKNKLDKESDKWASSAPVQIAQTLPELKVGIVAGFVN